MYEASSEARYAISAAMSSGVPARPTGTRTRGLVDLGRHRAGHLGVNEAGGDGVHRHALAGQLLGGGLGDADHAGFRGGVVRLARRCRSQRSRRCSRSGRSRARASASRPRASVRRPRSG